MEQVVGAVGLGEDFAESAAARLDAGAPVVDGVEPAQSGVVLEELAAAAAQSDCGG